ANLIQDAEYLTKILDNVLENEGGEALLTTVRTIRSLSTEVRLTENEETQNKIKQMIASLGPDTRQNVIRAFATHLHLLNIAEQNYRLRRRREYQAEDDTIIQPRSLEDGVKKLINNNIKPEQI